MRLSQIAIRNLRRIEEADITFAGATFLIGQNNYGKSSVLRAVELLLTQNSPDLGEFHVDASGDRRDTIEITGTFTGVDAETAKARGFKGRVVDGVFCYRKTYRLQNANKTTVECLEYPYSIRGEFVGAKKGQDLSNAGIPEEVVRERFGQDLSKALKKGWEKDVLDLVAEFDTAVKPTWVENPGGIPQNVGSKLPRLIHVPPITREGDVAEGADNKKTLMAEVLSILFADLLEGNPLAQSIQQGLGELQSQMSPENDGSLIRQLCGNVNDIIGSVFPGCGIKIAPSLEELTAVLKPKYGITMFSNTDTEVSRQGSGLLRTAVFSMLRYHSQLKLQKDMITQPLLVAFEEPELYLHPSAANLLRETIYALGATDQIICTTHSPWMIDLTQDLQSLTKMVQVSGGGVTAVNYEVAKELADLQQDDRTRVKMLQLFDDELSRVFFSDRVIVVEGDTEEVVFKATLNHLPESLRKSVYSTTQVVKARGKAAIISLVKYLKALSIHPFVMHDRDQGVAGAEVFNAHIANAAGAPEMLCVLEECIEDSLGYEAPSKDKPFHAYQCTLKWTGLNDVPAKWREHFFKAIGVEVPEVIPLSSQAVIELAVLPASEALVN